jgi:hypothetical protein
MLGAAPKSGQAWRQTEALLGESYSLFELMTENKGLCLETMLRTRIIPFLKKKMDTSKEVAATLDLHNVDRIDALYIKNKAIRMTNKAMADKIFAGEDIMPGEQDLMLAQGEQSVKEELNAQGSRRFYKPDELSDKTWKEQFKNLEWEVEVDITGEAKDTKDALTTLNTALQLVVTPGFDQNKRAQAIVGRILELTGAMSPIEYAAIPANEQPQPKNKTQPSVRSVGGGGELTDTKERNI